jgi:hypothetical protein
MPATKKFACGRRWPPVVIWTMFDNVSHRAHPYPPFSTGTEWPSLCVGQHLLLYKITQDVPALRSSDESETAVI